MADLDIRDKTTGKQRPAKGKDDALLVYLNSLLAGEDQTNDVVRTESQWTYVAITISASADVDIEHVAAASGDLLVGIQFNTAPGEPIIIRDGTTDVFTIPSPSAGDVWNAPGGGVVATTKWVIKDATAATDTVICVGRFS